MHPELYLIVFRQQESELERDAQLRLLRAAHDPRVVAARPGLFSWVHAGIAGWGRRDVRTEDCCPACCVPA